MSFSTRNINRKVSGGLYYIDDDENALDYRDKVQSEFKSTRAFRPTTAYTLKSPKTVNNIEKKAREILMKKVNCLGNTYKYTYDFAPTVTFFKLLSVAPRYQRHIPKLKV